jgi:FMN phosphatase YigB (HAD superfamily)
MYYIDFDNTLYETGKLTKDILTELANTIAREKSLNKAEILEDIKASFNSTVDNFFTLAKKLSIKYSISYKLLYTTITNIIITNGHKYVFPDALAFLKQLKEAKEDVCILTYVASSKNLAQQALKLTGSGILEYVSGVHNTTKYKYELNLDYKNNTFIDDSPRDLEGLYNAGARKLIRIKKPHNEKRTSKKLNLPEEIPTYTSFDEIPLPERDTFSKTHT